MDLGPFLSAITMGEYVAATDCRIAIKYFSDRGNEPAADEYNKILDDELRHFKMLKGILGRMSPIPHEVKALFRGEFLENHIGNLEPIVLMHAVFEPAAFAYLNNLRKLNAESLQQNSELKSICLEILRDEARHMETGLNFILPEVGALAPNDRSRLQRSIEIHQRVLATVPNATLGNDSIADDLVTSFQSNCAHCVKQIMR